MNSQITTTVGERKAPVGWVIAAATPWLAGILSIFVAGAFNLSFGWRFGLMVGFSLVGCLFPVIICGLKGKPAFVILSLSGMLLFSRVQIIFDAMLLLAAVGAIRRAKPGSWWARRYYGTEKMANAIQHHTPKQKKQQGTDLLGGLRKGTHAIHKLNGWQRAWVVLAIVWAIPILFAASMDYAHLHQMKKERDAILAKKAHEVLAEKARIASGEQVDGVVNGVWQPPARDWEVNEKAHLDELNKQIPMYSSHVPGYLTSWALPLIAIYLLGMGVAWIRAGFIRES